MSGVEVRLRKDLKRAVRVARFWKERWAGVSICMESSHRSKAPSIPEPHRYGHLPKRRAW